MWYSFPQIKPTEEDAYLCIEVCQKKKSVNAFRWLRNHFVDNENNVIDHLIVKWQPMPEID